MNDEESEKKKKVRVDDIREGDVLPYAREILERHIEEKTKHWGNLWAETVLKPQTSKDLLFGALTDMEETVFRMQAILINEKLGKKPKFSTNYELLKTYVNRLKIHIARIIEFLEDIGFDMQSPPTEEI